MRRFQGSRPQPPREYVERDITNAGSGPDYEGVVFSDGTVVVRWLTEYRSHSVWACWDDFYRVHGHPEYGTVITWLDPSDTKSRHHLLSDSEAAALERHWVEEGKYETPVLLKGSGSLASQRRRWFHWRRVKL